MELERLFGQRSRKQNAYFSGTGDEESGRVEAKHELPGRRIVVILDDVEPDLVVFIFHGDQHIDSAENTLEFAGQASIIEQRLLPFERSAEPDLLGHPARKILELAEVFRQGFDEVVSVDDDRFDAELSVGDHGFQAAQDLVCPGPLLVEVHDDSVLDNILVTLCGVF